MGSFVQGRQLATRSKQTSLLSFHQAAVDAAPPRALDLVFAAVVGVV